MTPRTGPPATPSRGSFAPKTPYVNYLSMIFFTRVKSFCLPILTSVRRPNAAPGGFVKPEMPSSKSKKKCVTLWLSFYFSANTKLTMGQFQVEKALHGRNRKGRTEIPRPCCRTSNRCKPRLCRNRTNISNTQSSRGTRSVHGV